jgi:protein Mpv17
MSQHVFNTIRNFYKKHIVDSKPTKTAKILFKKHLFVTNIGISFGLSGLGDIFQQKREHSKASSGCSTSGCSSKPMVNYSRTLHMSTSFGITSGFLCHFWYKYLDKTLPGHGIRTVVAKIAWDQILFSPVCIAACLLVAGRLENKSTEHLLSQTVQLGGRLYLAECLIWPPAQFINFYYLPTRYRVLYDNIISLVYDVYTSHVKHQVPVRDNFFQELENNQLVPRPEHFFEATEHLIDVTENMFDVDDGR